MKIVLILLFQLYLSTIMKRQNSVRTESNKAQIKLSNKGQFSQFSTNNKFKINNKTIDQIEVPDPINQPQPSQKSFQTYLPQVNKNQQDYDDLLFKKTLEQLTGQNDQEIHLDKKQVQLDCTKSRDCNRQSKIKQGKKQLWEIEKNLESALKTTGGKKPIILSGNVLNTIIQYIKHKDFVDALQNGFQRSKVPQKPLQLVVGKLKVDKKEDPNKYREELLKKRMQKLKQLLEKLKKQFKQAKENEDENQMVEIEQRIVQIEEEIDMLDSENYTIEELEKLNKELAYAEEYLEGQKQTNENNEENNDQDLEEEIKKLKEKIEILEKEKKNMEDINKLNEKEDNLEEDKETLIEDELKDKNENDEDIVKEIDQEIDSIEEEKEKKESENQMLDEDLNKDKLPEVESIEEIEKSLQEDENSQDSLSESSNIDSEEKNDISSSSDAQEGKNSSSKAQQKKDSKSKSDFISSTEHNFQSQQEVQIKERSPGEYLFKNIGISRSPEVFLNKLGQIEPFNKFRYYGDSIKDAQPLLLVLNSLENNYEKMFEPIDIKDENLPRDPVKNLKDILLLYHDFEKFLFIFEDNNLKFLKDLRFVAEKMQNMRDTATTVFDYYGFSREYDRIISKISPEDKDYQNQLEKINTARKSFFVARDSYLKNSDNIIRFHSILKREADYILSFLHADMEIKTNLKIKAVMKMIPKYRKIKEKLLDTLVKQKMVLHDILDMKDQFTEIQKELVKISKGEGKFQQMINDPLNPYSGQLIPKSLLLSFLLLIQFYNLNNDEEDQFLLQLPVQIQSRDVEEVPDWNVPRFGEKVFQQDLTGTLWQKKWAQNPTPTTITFGLTINGLFGLIKLLEEHFGSLLFTTCFASQFTEPSTTKSLQSLI